MTVTTENRASTTGNLASGVVPGALEAKDRNLNSVLGQRVFRGLLLVILFSVGAAYECLHLTSLSSVDIWGHLSAGLWMFQHRSLPARGIFSQYSDLSWFDSTWLFDVVLASGYKLIGLRAIPLFLMAWKVALAVEAFWLGGGFRGHFWRAVLLSALTQVSLVGLDPSPMVFSVFLFGIELFILFRAWDAHDYRSLYWLPLLFIAWVNLHLQFVLGLAILAFFTILLVGRWWSTNRANRTVAGLNRFAPVGGVLLVSIVVCALNPIGFRIFAESVRDVYSKTAFEYFPEMLAMKFRQSHEFVLILFLLITALVCGRARKKDWFRLALVAVSYVIALRIARDGWVAVMSSLLVVATAFDQKGEPQSAEEPIGSRLGLLPVTFAVLGLLIVFTARIPSTSELMTTRVAKEFPIGASDFIRQNRLSSPLFNNYEWGGFITWYLPEYPVSIDRRLALYDYVITDQHFSNVLGKDISAGNTFINARVLLLKKDSSLGKAIIAFPNLTSKYKVVYQDDIALVLVQPEQR